MCGVFALLDLLERVAPRLEFYPQGAKLLFAVTFVVSVLAVLVFVALYPSARRRVAREDSGG